jgi:hypothetical protein
MPLLKRRIPATKSPSEYHGLRRENPRARGVPALAILFAAALQSFGLDFMVATSFDRSFPDKWTHATAASPPHLSNRDTVYAGLPWRIHVFFREFSRDDSGKADLSFSYKILRAGGKTFFDTAGISAIRGVVDKETVVLLSHRIPIVTFSRKDTAGGYTLIVTAEDNIAKTGKTKEQPIILARTLKTKPTGFNEISFNVWIHSYCLDPDPGRAIAAFSFFIGNKMSDNNEIFWPVFYFFQCLFSDNPGLIQKLAAAIPKSPQRLQEYTVFLLRSIQLKRSDIEYPIPDSLWNKFDKAAANGFNNPLADAFLIKSDRLLEFGFYYYGTYALARFLIDCLDLNTQTGYEAFLGTCDRYSALCSKSLDKETALNFYSDARKILEKTYSKHPLINAYCNYAFENENLEAGAKQALSAIISLSKKRK